MTKNDYIHSDHIKSRVEFEVNTGKLKKKKKKTNMIH